jgi:hypothetical protein
MASVVRQLRRRIGMLKSRRKARAAAPGGYQRTLGSMTLPGAQLADVVAMLRVAVPAAAPVMLTVLLPPKLRVGTLSAPFGLEVMAAVSATLPVKPPAGVTVIVDIATRPALSVTAVPVMVKPGGLVPDTVTEACPEAPA